MLTDVLNINPEIVCGIIFKARVFHAKEEAPYDEKIPDSEYENDSWQILADHKDDLTYQEIKHVIEELEPDQQVDLLALMYLGRGDFEENEWSQAHKEARENIQPNLTGYLMSKPLIAEYLARGLSCLGALVSNPDETFFVSSGWCLFWLYSRIKTKNVFIRATLLSRL